MGNERLNEIKLSIHINHIDRSKDLTEYRKLLRILTCVAVSLGKEEYNALQELTKISVAKGYARATDKELVATSKYNFKLGDMCKRLGMTTYVFKNKYKDVIDDKTIDKEYVNKLEPMLKSSKSISMVSILNKFIEKFKIPTEIYTESKFEELDRTLELDFVLIYEKFMEIFSNYAYVDKLIYNLCRAFDIDYPTIAHLKNNIHLMNRSFPRYRYGHRYYMQELYNLYTARGYSKGAIGSKVVQKGSHYFHGNCGRDYAKVLSDEELAWQYIPTIEWDNLDRASVHKFIDILRDFVRYDI